jgi:hypothetical protein
MKAIFAASLQKWLTVKKEKGILKKRVRLS